MTTSNNTSLTLMHLLILTILFALLPVSTHAITLEDVAASFHPYKNDIPRFPGLSPGMVISASNVDHFKDIIDTELFKKLKDGCFEMKVGETTSFDLHPGYIAATNEALGKVSLGAEVGQINGYIAGRPFPPPPPIRRSAGGRKTSLEF